MAVTKEDIINSFYTKEGYEHTNILGKGDSDKDAAFIHNTILNMLEDGEVRFVFDDSTKGAYAAYIIFREENNLLIKYVLAVKNQFVFYIESCEWGYPSFTKLSRLEAIRLKIKLEEYIKNHPINIKIAGLKGINLNNIYEQSEKDTQILSDKLVRLVKLLANFLQYGILFLVFPVVIYVLIILDNGPLALKYLSVCTIIFGIYLIIGAKLRFRHIYCWHQLSRKQKMTPNEIYWNTYGKAELYRIPIINIIFGVIIMIVSIIQT